MNILTALTARLNEHDSTRIRESRDVVDLKNNTADAVDSTNNNMSVTQELLKKLTIYVSKNKEDSTAEDAFGKKGSGSKEEVKQETTDLLKEVTETQDEISEELVNIRKGYKINRNIYERVLYKINALRGQTSKVEKPEAKEKSKSGGGGLLAGLAGLLLGGLGLLGPLIAPLLAKLLKNGLTKMIWNLTKSMGMMTYKLGKMGVKAVWKVSKAVGKGLVKGGKSVWNGVKKVTPKVIQTGKNIAKGGKELAVKGAKSLGKVAKSVGRAGIRVGSKVASSALGLGRGMGQVAVRQVGGLLLRTGVVALASPLAVPLLIASAAAAVGFGAYKLAKYFKLSEKLDSFIAKVSNGKYKGVADFFWGIAKGEVAKDLFSWVKNKIGSMFEDSIGWLKNKANAILGRFSPWAEDTAEKRQAEKRNESIIKKTSDATTNAATSVPTPTLGKDASSASAPGASTLDTILNPNPAKPANDRNNTLPYFVGNIDAGANLGTGIEAAGSIDKLLNKTLGLNSTKSLANVDKAIAQYGDELNGATVYLSTGVGIDDKPNFKNAEEQIKRLQAAGAIVYVNEPAKASIATKQILAEKARARGARVAYNVGPKPADKAPAHITSASETPSTAGDFSASGADGVSSSFMPGQAKNASEHLVASANKPTNVNVSGTGASSNGVSLEKERKQSSVGALQASARPSHGKSGAIAANKTEIPSARSFDPNFYNMAKPPATYV